MAWKPKFQFLNISLHEPKSNYSEVYYGQFYES